MMLPVQSRINMALSQLYTNDVQDRSILGAMVSTPREDFVPEQFREVATVDNDLEVAPNRYLIAPLTFAKLLGLAQITPACRVLNIGCLSGYTAAVIAKMAGTVVAIENNAAFVDQARAQLARLKLANTTVAEVKSLAEGYPLSAPYDAIVISGAVEEIPDTLSAQLARSGRLVAIRNVSDRPGMNGGLGKGMLMQRVQGQLQCREYFDAPGVVLPGFETTPAFTL